MIESNDRCQWQLVYSQLERHAPTTDDVTAPGAAGDPRSWVSRTTPDPEHTTCETGRRSRSRLGACAMRLLFRVRTYVFCGSPSLDTDIRGTRALTALFCMGGGTRTPGAGFGSRCLCRLATPTRDEVVAHRGKEARDRRGVPRFLGSSFASRSSPLVGTS